MGDGKETKLVIIDTYIKLYKLKGKHSNSYSPQFANDHVIIAGIYIYFLTLSFHIFPLLSERASVGQGLLCVGDGSKFHT